MFKHVGKNLTIVLALVAVGFLVAWLRFRPYLGSEGRFSDGVNTYDVSGAEEVRYAVWAPRAELGGDVNSSAREGRAAVSPDGRWMVFGVGERGLGADLYIAELVDGEPRDPQPLAVLNTGADEMAPCFGRDALWFASDRRGTLGGLDLWRAPYRDGTFGEPERVNAGINSTADDTDPAPLVGAQGFVFASNRRRGLRDDYELYLARPQAESPAVAEREASREGDGETGAWSVESIEALNSTADEREPAFTRDGRCLFLASDRAGEPGDFDLYRSAVGLWGEERWVTPEPLVGVNTAASERAPSPSYDGFTLYFSSSSERQGADLFRARSLELFRTPGRPVGWRELLVIGLLLLAALLAWLAKRWEQVEIVYKCFLISLVVHLFLMWWMRDVYPEGTEYEMAGDSDRIRVRLVSSGDTAGRNVERSGQLELEREAERDDAAQPARRALERADPRADLAAGSRELELAAQAPREAPARAEREVVAAERALEPERVSTQRDVTPVELRAGERPDLDVAAAPTERQRVADPGAPPERVAAEAGSPVVASDAPRTWGRSGLDASVLAERETLVPDARESTAEPSRETRATPVATAQPSETFARRDEEAAEVALESRSFAGRAAPESVLERDRSALAADRPAPRGEETPSSRALELPSADESLPLARADLELTPEVSTPRSESIDVRAPEPAPAAAREREAVARAAPAPAPLSDLAPTQLSPTRLAPSRLDRATPTRAERRPLSTPRRLERPRERTDLAPLAMAMPMDTALPERDRTWDHTPYQTRVGEAKVRAIEEHGGSRETERAVEAGLAYLARVRSDQGFWGSSEDRDDKYGHVAVGKTGLCLLAFLGAGHTPGSETEYSRLTAEAVDFLLTVQDDDSGHFGYSSSYSHAIATYSLAECYAMTHSEKLRRPLERAVAHILEHQENSTDRRFHGGWGYYYPNDREYDPWPRVSVTVWQVMALESARIGGLSVPDRAFEDAHTFLRNAWDTDHDAFRYSHDPTRLRSNWPILPGSTPAALFALSLLGDDTSSRTFRPARHFVLDRAPRRYRSGSDDDFVLRARGNLYFWYYGTLALFRVGGEPWQEWNEAMKGTLLPAQEDDGSWEPISIYSEYAGDDRRDRSYTTAMCVLSLEVYYRYFTPLLKVE